MKAFLKRLFKIKRYFIVSYQFRSVSGSTGFATHVITTKGTYFNLNEAKDSISKDDRVIKDTISVASVTEISKIDYSYFIK